MKEMIFSAQDLINKFSNQSLSKTILGIEKEFQTKGEVICEIRANGMILNEADEAKFAETPLTEIHELVVKTNTVDQLLVDATSSTISYLNELNEVSLKASESFRNGDLGESMKLINSVINASQFVVEMLDQMKAINKQISSFEEEWVLTEHQFLNISREMLDAFEDENFVLLADLLEYEWTTIIGKWLSLLGRLDNPSIGAIRNGDR